MGIHSIVVVLLEQFSVHLIPLIKLINFETTSQFNNGGVKIPEIDRVSIQTGNQMFRCNTDRKKMEINNQLIIRIIKPY